MEKKFGSRTAAVLDRKNYVLETRKTYLCTSQRISTAMNTE